MLSSEVPVPQHQPHRHASRPASLDSISSSHKHQQHHQKQTTSPSPASTRDHLINEIVATERAYLRSLAAMQSYRTAMAARGLDSQAALLFANIQDLLVLTSEILDQIESFDTHVFESCLGELFLVKETAFERYFPFFQNYEQAIAFAVSNSELLKEFNPILQPHELQAHLIKPLQRLMKYPQLLNELIKQSREASPLLLAGQDAIMRVTKKLNESRREDENRRLKEDLLEHLEEEASSALKPKLLSDLLLADKLTVNGGDQELYTYLFENVVLFCKKDHRAMARRALSLNFFNKSASTNDKPQYSYTLVRVLKISSIVHVVDVSSLQTRTFVLAVHYLVKGKAEFAKLSIHFRNSEQVDLWKDRFIRMMDLYQTIRNQQYGTLSTASSSNNTAAYSNGGPFNSDSLGRNKESYPPSLRSSRNSLSSNKSDDSESSLRAVIMGSFTALDSLSRRAETPSRPPSASGSHDETVVYSGFSAGVTNGNSTRPRRRSNLRNVALPPGPSSTSSSMHDTVDGDMQYSNKPFSTTSLPPPPRTDSMGVLLNGGERRDAGVASRGGVELARSVSAPAPAMLLRQVEEPVQMVTTPPSSLSSRQQLKVLEKKKAGESIVSEPMLSDSVESVTYAEPKSVSDLTPPASPKLEHDSRQSVVVDRVSSTVMIHSVSQENMKKPVSSHSRLPVKSAAVPSATSTTVTGSSTTATLSTVVALKKSSIPSASVSSSSRPSFAAPTASSAAKKVTSQSGLGGAPGMSRSMTSYPTTKPKLESSHVGSKNASSTNANKAPGGTGSGSNNSTNSHSHSLGQGTVVAKRTVSKTEFVRKQLQQHHSKQYTRPSATPVSAPPRHPFVKLHVCHQDGVFDISMPTFGATLKDLRLRICKKLHLGEEAEAAMKLVAGNGNLESERENCNVLESELDFVAMLANGGKEMDVSVMF